MQTMYRRTVKIYEDGEHVDTVVRNVVKRSYKNRNALVRYQKLWRTAIPASDNLPDNHKEKIWIVVLEGKNWMTVIY